MHLLVTGGAGFIGSNFIRLVLGSRADWRVTNLDKLTYAGNLENLREIENDTRYRFVRGDIADRGLVMQVIEDAQCDAVINFAAESHVDRSILDASPFLETNVKGTQVLLEAARAVGVKKFIQVSTDEVYGSLQPDDPLFTEDSPLCPNSPYAASKAAADLLCRAYMETFGVPVIVTRCCNNFGPYQFPEKLMPLFITNTFLERPLPVYGDGLNVRDWIFVEDHCEALAVVLERGQPGEIYNVGAGCELTNLEVTHRILALLGKPDSLVRFVADRPGHDRRYAINPGKLMQELGWHPRYDFDQALERTVQWYQDNREWWERVRSGKYQSFYRAMYGKRFNRPGVSRLEGSD